MVSLSSILIAEKYFNTRQINNLVDKISSFESSIYIEKNSSNKRVNAKSCLGMLSLNLTQTELFKVILFHASEEIVKNELEKVLEIIKNL